MKALKKIYACIAIGLTISLGACTDLSENLYDTLSDQTVNTNDSIVVSAMMGQVYAQFRFLYWGWNGYFDLNEECADTYMTPKRIGIGWGDLYVNMHKHTWNSSQGHIEALWYYAYLGIAYSNKCLDVLPKTGNDQAEMRFMRAINYYILLDAFRNVPLETTQNFPTGYLPKQMPSDSIFNFCVRELNAVKDELGTSKIFGYPNRFAADMVLAKLYLNYNVYFGKNETKYYEKALDEVNDIISNGGYSLAANYADNFKEDITASKEVIFAIPLDKTHARHNYLINKCLVGAGAEAYGYKGSPWNGSCAIPQFIESYQNGDNRLGYTWTGGIQKKATKDASGNIIPQSGDPIAFSADDWSGTGYLNYSLKVHSIDNPGAYQQEGYRFVKYEIKPDEYGTYGDDVPFFRLADAMFIKAECLLRLGKDEQTAADLVTEVRSRSFTDASKAKRTIADLKGGSKYKYGHSEYTGIGFANWDASTYVSTTEGGDDIELGGLLDDLAWEFVGEHHRRQDLVRFKMSDGRSVFNGKSWFCKDATTDSYWSYFPIPKSAIDANITLKQNTGYSAVSN